MTAVQVLENDPVLFATRWLLNSGIQSLDKDRPSTYGGMYGWYVEESGYPFIYSESTGYALSMFSFLHTIGGDEVFLERAKLCAEWLLRSQREASDADHVAFPHSYREATQTFDRRAFTFDSAIIGLGLLRLHAKIADNRLLRCARGVAEWILRLQNPDGSIPAVVPEEKSDRWSLNSSPHHAKVAIFMFQMSRVSGDDEFASCGKRLLSWVRSKQDAFGWFRTPEGEVYVHPHCYACEGLLYAGLIRGDAESLSSASAGVRRLWSLEKKMPRWVGRTVSEFGPDVLSQAVRLCIISGEYPSNGLSERIEELRGWQVAEGSDRVRGAFLFSSSSPHANAITTMFSTQALLFSDKTSSEKCQPMVEHLI